MHKDVFRFENLEIWKNAITVSIKLFDIADLAAEKKLFRFSEQLNGAIMSISNNIAEGSGAFSKKEFAQFLNFSQRSVFECANIICILHIKGLLNNEKKEKIYEELMILNKRIATFRKTLL
ncbi:MAG: four helix bundle protein [Bacteroidia bacterium]|nr:four helix bundle protein [Bacteroidia bacterium]